MSQLLGATIAAITLTRDLIPINLAKGILGTVANILVIAQSVIKNQSDFQAIVDKCKTIREILERTTKGTTNNDLRGYLGHALSQLNKSYSLSQIDRDRIAGWEKDLDRVLLLFNTEAITGMAIRVEKLVLGLDSNATATNVIKHYLPAPPPCPSMFYGRQDLVAELTNLVINDEHIALIGPGGMGKSSLAKAILNEPLVTEKFADRRFFVTYDGLDPSSITFQTFITCFAGALGIELSGADPVRQISYFLRSASALVVLDNAETFEEASGSSALGEIPPAIAVIADIPGVILILTSHSRRNAPNQSGWSLPMLLKRWKDWHSKVLDHGKGKLQSLLATMQLSLSSPSIQNLGKDGCRVLSIIAFLPQGLNEDLASDLLLSLPQVDTICDVLCRQSLIYRHDSFIKMLAPIRHFVRDLLQPPDFSCLQDIHAFYCHTVQQCSVARDNYAEIVILDHLNIEYLVAFDLARVPDGAEVTYDACWRFLKCLEWHLPHPTTLTPAIFKITENPSTWAPKARCLQYLGLLYNTVTQLTEGLKAFKAA
ncbi:hypothetical protein DFH29DRAFT_875054 [Suillus ampliporus]|nr:hypothetical protein DFH29DRAFT_875054 [Suillus ampliporus]